MLNSDTVTDTPDNPVQEIDETDPPAEQVNGVKLAEGCLFCPKCGTKVQSADNDVANKINQYNASVDRKKHTKKILPIIIAAAAIVVILIVVLVSGGGAKDFRKMYADIANESWCTIASDGSYMKIDTNPYNRDDYSITAAYLKLKTINSDLGFSSAVFDDMGSTRALDGKQTAESPKAIVTWRYHPDNGLEATYSWK